MSPTPRVSAHGIEYSLLANIGRLGEPNLTHLMDVLVMDQTTLTRGLRLLEDAGLLERVPHPDARVKPVRLTDKGQRAVKSARPLWARAQRTVIRRIGVSRWAQAQRDLLRLMSVTSRTEGRLRSTRRT